MALIRHFALTVSDYWVEKSVNSNNYNNCTKSKRKRHLDDRMLLAQKRTSPKTFENGPTDFGTLMLLKNI